MHEGGKEMAEPIERKWFDNPILELVALLFVWPLGVYGLAKNSWKGAVKVLVFILSIPVALFTVVVLFAMFTVDWSEIEAEGRQARLEREKEEAAETQTAQVEPPPPAAPRVVPKTVPKEVPRTVPKAAPQKKPKPRRRGEIGIGTPFSLGGFTYTIRAARTTPVVGGEFSHEVAPWGATFLLVHFSIRNDTSRTATVLAEDFKIEDGKGRTFDPSSDASTALLMAGETDDWLFRELQPGITQQGICPFLIPNDALAPGLTLVVPEKGFWKSKEVRISLYD